MLDSLEHGKTAGPSAGQMTQLFHSFLSKYTREERMQALNELEFTPGEMGQVIFDYFDEFKDALVQVEYGKALISMKESQTFQGGRNNSELSDLTDFYDDDHTINPYDVPCTIIE